MVVNQPGYLPDINRGWADEIFHLLTNPGFFP